MIQLILNQLLSWYLQVWPNVVATPITAWLTWLLHRMTFHRHAERRHQEVLDALKKGE